MKAVSEEHLSEANKVDETGAHSTLDALVARIDSLDWQRVANSVYVAYQFLDPANVPPDVESEKAKARKDIEADKSLTPEKRTQALEKLDEQYAAVANYVPLPGNIDTVRPFADRIKAMIGQN